jgi:hypothetical protein
LSLTFLDGDDRISVCENAKALPRAYYVPQIAGEPDDTLRLRRLARPGGDRRRQALVNAAPASGFLGVPDNQATAEARFVIDDPEHVVIETVAPAPEFLFLADQYYPAWLATVNGQPAPILIANHAFRLVEVPSGPVTVEFPWWPRSAGSRRKWPTRPEPSFVDCAVRWSMRVHTACLARRPSSTMLPDHAAVARALAEALGAPGGDDHATDAAALTAADRLIGRQTYAANTRLLYLALGWYD